jgi:hypothetical protein
MSRRHFLALAGILGVLAAGYLAAPQQSGAVGTVVPRRRSP